VRDVGYESEQDIVREGEAETTFSFAIDPLGSSDNEIDAGVVESVVAEAAAEVYGAKGGNVTFESCGSDF